MSPAQRLFVIGLAIGAGYCAGLFSMLVSTSGSTLTALSTPAANTGYVVVLVCAVIAAVCAVKASR